MNNGFIKLHRKFLNWEWRDKPEMVALFIHFLLLANHKEGKWQGQVIKPGQFVTGLKSLSKTTGISVQTLRTCITKLKSTGEITNQSTNQFRLISIVNWQEYQSKSTSESTSDLTFNQQSTNNQLTPNKKDKKEKNDKNITKVIDELGSSPPKKVKQRDKRIDGIISYMLKVRKLQRLDGTNLSQRNAAAAILKHRSSDPQEIKQAIDGSDYTDLWFIYRNWNYLIKKSQPVKVTNLG